MPGPAAQHLRGSAHEACGPTWIVRLDPAGPGPRSGD